MTTTDDPPTGDLALARATPADAAGLVEVVHAAFGARPPLDPPAPALSETTETLVALMATGGGVVARIGADLAGVILLTPKPDDPATGVLQRVSVHPRFQRHGVASAMVAVIEPLAVELGFTRLELVARREIPGLVGFWQHRGFGVTGAGDHLVPLAKDLPVVVTAATAADMRALGARLAGMLRSGDLIIAHGDLGAGKTTFTQGLAAGLGVGGSIISPTFVLSRDHPSTNGGPSLVHVDAYRLSSPAELDDLGLDTESAVTVVEWGVGMAEQLADDRLVVAIHRDPTGPTRTPVDPTTGDDLDDLEPVDVRTVVISAFGERWDRAQLAAALVDPPLVADHG